jgi:8-hydroxy-5-deazaflavin:NADPH oxidoreductase
MGHEVMVGTRDPEETASRAEPDTYGNPPFSVWQEEHPEVRLATFSEAAAYGEMVVNATPGTVSLKVLELASETNLNGKILIDVANPLDFSQGMPPTLSVSNTDSLGEQIQRRFPDAKVVKTLHTMNAYLMVDPTQLAGADHTVFVCGDDAEAKAKVTELLQSFGWTDIIDLGDIPLHAVPRWCSRYGCGCSVRSRRPSSTSRSSANPRSARLCGNLVYFRRLRWCSNGVRDG